MTRNDNFGNFKIKDLKNGFPFLPSTAQLIIVSAVVDSHCQNFAVELGFWVMGDLLTLY